MLASNGIRTAGELRGAASSALAWGRRHEMLPADFSFSGQDNALLGWDETWSPLGGAAPVAGGGGLGGGAAAGQGGRGA